MRQLADCKIIYLLSCGTLYVLWYISPAQMSGSRSPWRLEFSCLITSARPSKMTGKIINFFSCFIPLVFISPSFLSPTFFPPSLLFFPSYYYSSFPFLLQINISVSSFFHAFASFHVYLLPSFFRISFPSRTSFLSPYSSNDKRQFYVSPISL